MKTIFFGALISSALGSRKRVHKSASKSKDLHKVFDLWPGFKLDWPESRLSCKYPNSNNCNAVQFAETADFSGQESFFNVYPGGETQCVGGAPYYFTVRLGDPDKLHIHFQAGGACWGKKDGEDETTNGSLLSGCRVKVHNQAPLGFATLNDDKNPWTNYSLVVINYCSGDAHVGHAEHRWGSRPGGSRPERTMSKLRGFENAFSALTYAKSNFGDAARVTVSGSSGGSIASVFWTRWIADNFEEADLTVIGDSFFGIMHPYSERFRMENVLFTLWGACNPVLFSSENLGKCKSGQLSLLDLREWNLQTYPRVRTATVNAKADIVQRQYEKTLAADFNNPAGEEMSRGIFYKEATLQVKEYLKYPNYFNFWVHSRMHVLLYADATLQSTRTNVVLSPSPGDVLGTKMVDWLAEIVNGGGSAKRSECFGPPRSITRKSWVSSQDIGYCLMCRDLC